MSLVMNIFIELCTNGVTKILNLPLCNVIMDMMVHRDH